ncbi:TetR family transcriptional regulator [Streptomyces sp. DG2A-72]|uniref:TetR family transcriptional regulator n=1 Tax=Streptomyces sp. DG2A-72 TaxID=3051386 RepID=UPI0034646952
MVFCRYFATKEEAVAPLYTTGAQRWAEAVREAPAELPLPEALEHAVRHTLTPGTGVSAASWEWVRTLVRLAMTSPALRKVWGEVCLASETSLAVVLGERGGVAEGSVIAEGDDIVAERSVVSPELRYAAAVAGAAVRVAVESWASGEAPATGPEGPAALALRNLEAVRGFWGEALRGGQR